MDTQKILKADYIDILYDGKNKLYGGYELRKQYNQRAKTAFGICAGIIAALVSFHLISFAEKNVEVKLEPPLASDTIDFALPPIEEIEPPVKMKNIEPPPAPPMEKYTQLVVAPNDEVSETEVIQNTPTDKIPGPDNFDGEPGNPTDLNPGLNGKGKPGIVTSFGEEEGERVNVTVDRMPTPTVNIKEFIEKHLKYPSLAVVNEIEGRVMLKFIVEKDGSISNIEVASKKNGSGLEEEAIRIMKKIPPYKPGELNGKPVRVSYFQVIIFQLSR